MTLSVSNSRISHHHARGLWWPFSCRGAGEQLCMCGHMGKLNPVDSAGSWKGDYTWRTGVLPFVLHHSRRAGQILQAVLDLHCSNWDQIQPSRLPHHDGPQIIMAQCCHSCPLWVLRDHYEVLDLFLLPGWNCSLSAWSPLSFQQGIKAVISSRPTCSHPRDPLHSEKNQGNYSLTQNLWTVRLSEGLLMNCVLQRKSKTHAHFICLQSCNRSSPWQRPWPEPRCPSPPLSPLPEQLHQARLAAPKPDCLLLQGGQERHSDSCILNLGFLTCQIDLTHTPGIQVPTSPSCSKDTPCVSTFS